ncbi:ammonia-forming cytochrome c nitrite reductase subunit c552 [Propioniciclava coleopterorum]|uniref:nitrite reductase (cytochrome; ammonia-forming) n=1 Tax=Propioniciclava coleopterorum TaxID=2714937 RepID=A0A6G7Y574_9ACTN|nr:ammonia-forming cytochrome c nitrite reductase subunit c552 [Propioniciclava coleopterorum]QIK71972.1 ammonia-forming cytochrome c nitrite reductase subunit c552 [Propioniciclava coleopterorum]
MAKETRTKPRWLIPAGVFLIAGALVTLGIASLLMSIMEKRNEAQTPYFPVVQLDEKSFDPADWGKNFPLQYEGWLATKEMPVEDQQPQTPTATDPRTIVAKSKIEEDPRLVTMWQGYAFAVDYRHPRGHAYMLEDQRFTKRVTSPQFKQPGACLNCHASTVPIMDELGNGDRKAGFDVMNKMTYQAATELAEHPVACIDCHDPKTMALRVTRPAFEEGIKEYKAGQGIKDYDVNRDATAQEMRSFVCAQCHVEYYFKGEEKTLTFPWDKGLTADDALAYYDEVGWSDFTHKLTGAKAVKAQHPDFETWSQGVHAKSGVTCADCHMPYQREGAAKVSDHQIASPMRSDESINASCLTCHSNTEQQMRDRVEGIHSTYEQTKNVAFDALTALIYDIEAAQKNGTPEAQVEAARGFQRKAQFFLDYVVSENSRGFHAPAYTNRLLNDVTDASRRGQMALRGVEYEPAGPPTPAPIGQPTLAPDKRK